LDGTGVRALHPIEAVAAMIADSIAAEHAAGI
jgi:hypothetical protein